MYSKNRQFGNRGEDFAVHELTKLGYSVLERNYLKPYGEIDIVARGTDGKIHFVEVKTIQGSLSDFNKSVSRDTYSPFENVTREKVSRLERTLTAWMLEKGYEGEWCIDVMGIILDANTGMGKYTLLQNVY